MSLHVFLGPSLPIAEAQTLLPTAHFHPPVVMGDVATLLRQSKVSDIAIIDGYFEAIPAVWHKELLFALSTGVRVYGASSMGALRAAELCSFGMIGVGEIFQLYRDGVIDADDEVTISHASAEYSYRPLSDALVNIRYGLRLAEAENVIDRETHDRILSRAQKTFYPHRRWSALLDVDEDSEKSAALRAFVGRRKPDRKREDAVLLLQLLADEASKGPRVTTVPQFDFERTLFWQDLEEQDIKTSTDVRLTDVLNEIRLSGDLFCKLRRDALLRQLTKNEALRLGIEDADEYEFDAAATRFREQRKLYTEEETLAWLNAHEIDDQEFVNIVTFEQKAEKLHGAYSRELDKLLLSELKSQGLWEATTKQLADREAFFSNYGVSEISFEVAGIEIDTLYEWYESTIAPFRGTPEETAKWLGFETLHQFEVELLRRYYGATRRNG